LREAFEKEEIERYVENEGKGVKDMLWYKLYFYEKEKKWISFAF